jgi:hypothetical protein
VPHGSGLHCPSIVMPRAITHCGTLWTLRCDGKTARAEIVDIEGIGLELRYTRNDKPFVRCIFTDGADLLPEPPLSGSTLNGMAGSPTRALPETPGQSGTSQGRYGQRRHATQRGRAAMPVLSSDLGAACIGRGRKGVAGLWAL